MRLAMAVGLLVSTAAFAQEMRWGERYTHQGHAAKMQQKGQPSPACRSCHQLDGRDFRPLAPGKNNHKPCTDCHGGAGFMQRGPRCLTCHSSMSGFRPGRPWFPPFRDGGEFHTVFPHAKHVAMMGPQHGDNCGGCHVAEEGRGRPGAGAQRNHAMCAGCHAGRAQPDMNACEGCHLGGPAPPKPASAAREPSVFRTTAKFTHAQHASHALKRGVRATCASCHVGLAAQEPPGRPQMQTCEGCHDGRQAFDARGTLCARCHQREGKLALSPPMPPTDRPFRHATHQTAGVDVRNCVGCHGVGMDWHAVQAGHNQHQPCQGCHAAEFRMVGQKICLNCHERNDPFAPNPLRPPAPQVSEWRLGDVPHPPHLAAGVSCVTCHWREAGVKSHGEHGHSLCGKCHTAEGRGAKLVLSACATCHVSITLPRESRALRPWSTGARFKHDEHHRVEKCEKCHHQAGAPTLTPPTMAMCAERCHNGDKAFKVTGFGCARCHGREKSTR